MDDKFLIYPERDNKDQKLSQIKPCILPLNMNPQFQNNLTQGRPYISMDLDNTPKNAISPDLNDPMIQPLFPPSQDNDLPIQEGLSLDNNIAQTKTPDDTPYILQPVSQVYQSQYESINNISEIPHKSINEIDENTFFISAGYCSKAIPSLFFLFIGIGVYILCYYFFLLKGQFIIFFFYLFLGGCLISLDFVICF